MGHLTPAATLRTSLERHNGTFELLLKLIPPKYYLVEEGEEQASRYQKHIKKQKASKQAIKEASKKAKREKLDPTNNKTVVDIQSSTKAKKSIRREKAPASDDSDENDMDVDASLDLDSDAGKDAAVVGIEDLVPMPASSGISVLREKLHARIAQFRQGGIAGNNVSPGGKDGLLEERRRQRAAVRERRRKETKEKIRMEKEKAGKGQKGKEKEDEGKLTGKEKRDKAKLTKTQLLVTDETSPQSSLATVAFSTVKGSSSSSSKLKSHVHIQTSSNPAQALNQLAAKSARMTAMSEEKRQRIQEEEQWGKAEMRMEGGKVRDDETRLKKVLKRKEKQKEKGRKEWNERKEQVTQAMAARQKKRTDNIAMRAERRKGGKEKKGKGRPGFEGKAFGKVNAGRKNNRTHQKAK